MKALHTALGRRSVCWAALAVLFAAGLYLRFPWPTPAWFHVDERAFVLHPLGFWSGDFNPHFFNYPTLHFYLASALYYLYYLFVDESFSSFVAYRYFVDGGDLIGLVRGLNSILSALTGVVCALIGRRLYGLWGGLWAGVFFAALPLSVRFAHLAIVDVPHALWGALALYFSVLVAEEGRLQHALLGGVFVGLSLATKYPGALYFVPLGLACGLRFGWLGWPLWGSGVLSLVVFSLCSPYVWLDWSVAWAAIAAMGTEHVLDTAHASEISALWHHVRYNLRYGIGLFGLVGLLGGAVVRWRSYRWAEWVLVASLLSWILLLTVSSSVFMRYALPLMPLVVLLWVRGLWSLAQRSSWFWALGPILLAEPLYGTLQTRALLAGSDTRVMAQQWIANNAPPGVWVVELSSSASLSLLHPKEIYGREHRFTNSYERADLTAAYALLAERRDLPSFVVDVEPEFATDGTGRVAALLVDCAHSLCAGERSEEAERLRGRTVWQNAYGVGDWSSAVFDPIDWYFVPIGGFGAVGASGPELRVGSFAAPDDWRGGDASQFFAMLRDFNRLEEYVDRGDWEAGKALATALQDNTLLRDVVVSKVYLGKFYNYAGLCNFKLGYWSESINYWERALQTLGGDFGVENQARLLSDLGVVYAREGRYGDALRVWQQSAALLPEYVDSYYNAAHVYVHNLRRFAAALPLLQRIFVLESDHVEAHLLAGVAYYQLGDFSGAATNWTRVLQLAPGHPQAAEIRRLLSAED